MKRVIELVKHKCLCATALLLITSLGWSSMAAAAVCSSTDYVLSTQAEVDALGATGCDSVAGNLEIEYVTDITSLDGLSNITSVGRNLTVGDNDVLTNLDGLSNITSVGRDLVISSNAALTNLDGLAGLSSVGRKVSIGHSREL